MTTFRKLAFHNVGTIEEAVEKAKKLALEV